MRNLGQHISDLQSGYKEKTGESRGSSAPATIPSASRSKKTTTPTRAGRRRDGSYYGRPARGVEVKLRVPRSSGTDLKVLGFNIGAQVARQYRAGRVFSLQATRLVSSTRRWARRQHRSPGRPQRGLEAEAAVLHGQAGAALLDTSITMNGTRSDCSVCAEEAFARFGSHMGQGAEVTHSSTMGR
jgi:hypothetical protein